MKEEKKNKKVKIVVGLIALIIVIAIIATVVIINLKNQEIEKQKQAFNTYIALINDKNYDEMYNKISNSSKSNISSDDFVKRNKNIYEGIDAENIKVELGELTLENNEIKILYKENMVTSAGEVSFDNTVTLVKENNEYKIRWSSKLIFPDLGDTDKVRVSSIKSKRGTIKDKNGNNLAYDGVASSVGIVPGKLGENRDSNIAKISELLGVSVDTINNYLSASYVKDDTFVPIKKIAYKSELKATVLNIPGIMLNSVDSRVYNLGEEAGHLVGYVQAINAEELEKNEGKGYTSTSLIGKSGLELTYEDTLRGIDGTEIYIQTENGQKIKTIAQQDKKDGQDINLTIDANVQTKLYNQMKDDNGLFVVMEPQTGELLALVSTPSYDSNDFTLGMTTAKWDSLNNDVNKPLYNRFLQSYCPGSTFKPITGAAGLTSGKLSTDNTFTYSGTSWQKDSSWGDYKVTTLTAYSGAKNLRNALIHSDNIFFAQAALQIGKDTLTSKFNELGFNEQLDLPLTAAKSTYGEITSDGKLADTGFGQGNLLVNPIHMASMYSAFANNGNMIKPYLVNDDNNSKGKILKENVFTKEAANTIKDDLIQVVENSEGTARDAAVSGLTIAGKTGTAELKTDKNDSNSGTLGWFNCFTTNRDGQNLLIVGMVENTQNNSDGGSHYVIKKIKAIL